MVGWPPINHVMASNKNIAGPDQTTLVGQCGCGSKLGTPNPSYKKPTAIGGDTKYDQSMCSIPMWMKV